jgi:hypothetical protein
MEGHRGLTIRYTIKTDAGAYHGRRWQATRWRGRFRGFIDDSLSTKAA